MYVSEDGSNQMVAVMRDGWVLSQRLNPTPTAEAIKAMSAIHFKDLDTTEAASGNTQKNQ